MENLTQTHGVVKPNVAAAPMAGHKIVIFENTMKGTKLKAILNPDDSPFKKKFNLFSPPPNYTCYAITSDSKLNFDFNADMTLSHQHQSFTLNCSVYYHVSDPGAMALAFNTDPISRIRDEIKNRLQINILQSKIRIENIRDDFFALKDKILPSATLNQLRDFVRAFGVVINEIDMTYKIPEKFLKPDLKKVDYYLEKETEFIEADEKRKKGEEEKEKLRHRHDLRKIEHEHEKEELIHKHDLQTLSNEQEKLDIYHKEEMEDVKGFHEFKREMPKRLITAIDKAIDHIDGPGSLERVADSALGVIDLVTNKLQNPNIIQLYRHTKVDFPKKCLLDEEVELSIQLAIEKPLESLVAQIVPLPILDSKELIKLTLHVTAPGFHIDNARETMNVPTNDDSEKVIFKMKSLSAGNQLVEVEIYFNALRIGYFALEIQVKEVSYDQS